MSWWLFLAAVTVPVFIQRFSLEFTTTVCYKSYEQTDQLFEDFSNVNFATKCDFVNIYYVVRRAGNFSIEINDRIQPIIIL